MLSKIVLSVAAGALILIVGLVVWAVAGPETVGSEEDLTAEEQAGPGALRILEDVLDELVDEGTIGEDQAAAVLAAAESELDDLDGSRPELDRGHPGRGPFGLGVRAGGLLDRGGISEEEYETLDEDHPLRSIDIGDALDDGLITPQELRDILREHKGG
jgi:hypothetical protein